jgi:hypothetical protein
LPPMKTRLPELSILRLTHPIAIGRPLPRQPLEFRDLWSILAVAVLWAVTRRRGVPQEDSLPIGQDRGGKLVLAAQLRAALGS